MLLGYVAQTIQNVGGCIPDPPEGVHFGGSDTGAATSLESPRNITFRLNDC